MIEEKLIESNSDLNSDYYIDCEIKGFDVQVEAFKISRFVDCVFEKLQFSGNSFNSTSFTGTEFKSCQLQNVNLKIAFFMI